jgi:hypothetical protein
MEGPSRLAQHHPSYLFGAACRQQNQKRAELQALSGPKTNKTACAAFAINPDVHRKQTKMGGLQRLY